MDYLLIKNFIFDFDGTLVNSDKFHSQAFKKTLAISNKNLLINFNYEEIKGLSTEYALDILGIKENKQKFAKLKRKYFIDSIKKVSFFKDSLKTINFLKSKKKNIYIVSGSSKKNINFLLKKKNINVNGIISREDTVHSKPHPMPFKMCLEKYKLKKTETIVIEDAASGIYSAKKNNLKTIGINNKKIQSSVKVYFNNFTYFLEALKKK
jgi:HAD superfamily hydrolase (TIGR01509 family)